MVFRFRFWGNNRGWKLLVWNFVSSLLPPLGSLLLTWFSLDIVLCMVSSPDGLWVPIASVETIEIFKGPLRHLASHLFINDVSLLLVQILPSATIEILSYSSSVTISGISNNASGSLKLLRSLGQSYVWILVNIIWKKYRHKREMDPLHV